MWDYYRGKGGREVIERDDGLIDPSDVAPKLYFEPFDRWPAVERRAIGFARGRVLDVGCGAGRVGLYLQAKGHDVLGIDTSPLALKVSRLRGLKKTRLLDFGDVGFGPGSFDTVVLFGGNFGLFGNRAKARRLLRRLYGMTSAEGVIIGEVVDPYKTDNPDHLAYQRHNRSRGRMSGQVVMRARYRTFVGPWLEYFLVSPEEMKDIAAGTGWYLRRVVASKKSPVYVGILGKL